MEENDELNNSEIEIPIEESQVEGLNEFLDFIKRHVMFIIMIASIVIVIFFLYQLLIRLGAPDELLQSGMSIFNNKY